MPRVPDFSSLSVLVVGDLVADRWIRAEPSRVSREAPVLVLRHRADRMGAGGAANVARNLRALGAEVPLLGVVARVAARAYALGENVDAIVVSDHELGVAGLELGAVAAELARTGRIAVLDPRASMLGFAGLTAITPNVEDLARFAEELGADAEAC